MTKLTLGPILKMKGGERSMPPVPTTNIQTMKTTFIPVPESEQKILTETWGYSMTIVEFYKIVGRSASGKTLKAVEIAQKSVEHDGYGQCGWVTADPTKHLASWVILRPKTNTNGSVTYKGTFYYAPNKYDTEAGRDHSGTRKHVYAHEWDGQKKYFNHLD